MKHIPQKRYSEKRKLQGYVRVCVIVNHLDRGAIMQAAQDLRNKRNQTRGDL